MIVTLSLFAVVLSYFTLPWLWRKLKRKNARDPPMYPGELPAIGHAHLLIGDTVHLWNRVEELSNVSLENGGVVTISLGTWKLYVLTEPEDCFLVGNACLDKDVLYDLARPWLGDGLGTAPAHTWKRHRKLINPAFSQQVLDGYLTVFNAQSRRMADTLAEKAEKGMFNHVPYLDRLTLETLSLTAMGINDKDEILKDFSVLDAVDEILHIIIKRVQSVWMMNEFLFKFTKLKKRHDDLIKISHEMSNQIIQKRKSAIFESKNCPNNSEDFPKRYKTFVDLLLESSKDSSLTDREIREQVDTMILAGYDTLATLMTFSLVIIGSYPDVQEKIYEELQEVFKGTDRHVEKEDLPKLVYLEAVLREVLRLYPIAPIVGRHLYRDVELKNYTLSAGNSCFIVVYGLNRHPAWGADRMQFRPSRWLNPAELPDLTKTFGSFGIGKRNCIGQKFAFMSAKTTLSHVLRRYRIHADHTKMVLKIDIMLKPSSGHYISIEKR